MDKLIEYVQVYGLSILVIAVCIIAFIGILKVCKLFDKISNKNLKKFIYYGLDIVLAFGGSAIYFACFHKSFNEYVVYCVSELTVATTLYAVYENCGIRSLVKSLLTLVAGWCKTNPDKQISKWADTIQKLQDKIAKVEETKIEAPKVETAEVENTEVVKTEDNSNQVNQ